ncbi:MAG TPA: zinc metalloprotease HtpX [Terriglobia bacterium]|nr:zinc metalloprotease HtpX [Terriglobia bacterium]
MNTVKTIGLMVGLMVLLVFVGGYFGGRNGMVLFFGIGMVMNLITYWFSDKIVLRMYGAQEVTEREAPVLYSVTRELASRGQMPMPKVYLIPSAGLNAFATGRNPKHAAVAATQGLVQALNREELTGVMAHELSHVQNRDILIGTIAAAIAGAISMVASMAQWGMIFGGFGGRREDDRGGGIGAILMIILAPIAAMLIQMAISRSREYQADASGARLCGNPRALASALRKLQMGTMRAPMDANPATAHMFIVNPLRGGGFASMFSTHPPMDDRIARLESMII